jgi:hypothetical protein
MDSSRASNIIRGLTSHPFFVPIILGLLVLGVLIHGGVNRGTPVAKPAVVESEPRNEPLVAIRSGLDKLPLDYFSEYWFQLGDDVRRVLVEIGPSRTPGVIVAPGVVISTLGAADEVRHLRSSRESWQSLRDAETSAAAKNVPGDSAEIAGPPEPAEPAESAEEPLDRVLLTDAGLGLALFEAPGLQPAQPLVAADSGLSYPGILIAAVGLAPNGRLRIAPGHLGSSAVAPSTDAPFARLDVTIHLPFLRGTAAVVDLNGELHGVALEGPSEPRMIAWPTIRALLDQLSRGEPCRAIEVSDLDAAAAEMLELSRGVLIETVQAEAYASAAPVRAGDILLDWAGQPVTDAAVFRSLYDASEAGSQVEIVFWRDGRRIGGRAIVPGTDCRPVADPPEVFAALGFTAHWTNTTEGDAAPAGWQVLAVRPGGRTDAVLEIGDRLVSVNGRTLQGPRSVRSLQRYDSTQKVLLGVWRRGRARMLVLTLPEPEPEAIDP